MHTFAEWKMPVFLRDHPPVLRRMVLASGGSEVTHLAGTVLGRANGGDLVPWERDMDVEGVLATDVTVPASGGITVDVYVHASVVADGLVWADGVSAEDEKAALTALRAVGIYA